MMSTTIKSLALLTALFTVAAVTPTQAASVSKDGKHQVVIQVSSGDEATQNLALNNVANLQEALGIDNVEIEVVAYGPGLSILTKANKEGQRVESLAVQGVTFSACGNTIKGVTKKTGKEPVLLKGVKVVPGGVVRLMELQEKGYSYVRP